MFISGALILGKQLGGGLLKKKFIVTDILSHPIGIETNDKRFNFEILINKNAALPVHSTQLVRNDQVTLGIYIREGILTLWNRANIVGKFNCSSILPMSCHQDKIFVKLSVDINGLLKVIVRDATTIKNNVQLDSTANLLPEQINHLIQNDRNMFEFRDPMRLENLRMRENFERKVFLTWRCVSAGTSMQDTAIAACKTILEGELIWLENNQDVSVSHLYRHEEKLLHDLSTFEIFTKKCGIHLVNMPKVIHDEL